MSLPESACEIRAAVESFLHEPIGAHGQAIAGVLEPDIEQRCFTGEVFELLGPGSAAVLAGEDLGVMPHGPAVLVVDEENCSEQLADHTLIVYKERRQDIILYPHCNRNR